MVQYKRNELFIVLAYRSVVGAHVPLEMSDRVTLNEDGTTTYFNGNEYVIIEAGNYVVLDEMRTIQEVPFDEFQTRFIKLNRKEAEGNETQ